MSNLLISIVSAGLVLGFLVLAHEWAHYIVAKACGVTVRIFSIGFGKRLAGFERNGTDYRISALPFGGYVKMAGDNPMEGTTGDPGEFRLEGVRARSRGAGRRSGCRGRRTSRRAG